MCAFVLLWPPPDGDLVQVAIIIKKIFLDLLKSLYKSISGVPPPIRVDVKSCDAAPCILPRGSDIYVETTYTSSDQVDELGTYSDFLEIESGISGNFPLPGAQKDTCRNLVAGRCPVYPYEEITFALKMPVLAVYPKNLDLDLRISVRDKNNKFHTCYQILTRTSG